MISDEKTLNDISSGVSMESAASIENTINDVQENNINPTSSEEIIEEYTPKVFSQEQSFQGDTLEETNTPIENEPEQLFDQDTNEEEDFEIPAFLRKQKF